MSPGWEGLLSAIHGVQKLKLPISQSTLYRMYVQCTFFIVQNNFILSSIHIVPLAGRQGST